MKPIGLIGIRNLAFVCGCSHTGTTLVATILSAHPEIYVPYVETGIYCQGWWHRTKWENRLRWRAFRAGRRYVVEKTPSHIRKMDVIRRRVPGVRFVVMVRDGRDVAASVGRRFSGDFERGLQRWERGTSIAYAERGKPDVYTLLYESLVTDPAGKIRDLCGFLGIPYQDGLLEYHRQPRRWFRTSEANRTSGVGGEHNSLRNWQVNQPIFDGRGRWRSELPAEYVARFNSGRLAELMDAFGYERE